MKSKKPSPNQLAIETFALAREWIFKPYQELETIKILKSKSENSNKLGEKLNSKVSNPIAPWKASDLYLFLDELHTSEDTKEREQFSKAMKDESDYGHDGKKKTSASEKLRKRYEPYLKEFSRKYNLPVSFQDKTLDASFEEFPMNIIQICKDYIDDFAYSYSPEALELVVRNWEPMGDVLYFFVLLRYAIGRKTRMEFNYEKTMRMESTSRRVVPLLLTNIEGKLSLIARDLKDEETKSFPISRIKNVKSDLRQIISSVPEESSEDFDYNQYKRQNPNATFQDKKILYEIEISASNLNLLQHSETLIYKEMEKKTSREGWKVIQVETYRERDLFDILFNYGTFAKLLSPPESVAKFKQKLSELNKFYS